MQLRTSTENLFKRFESTGSLGQGAERKNLSMMESMETVGFAIGADCAVRYDNSDIDQNPAQGLIKFDRAAFEGKVTAELESQMPGLASGGPSVSKEEVDQMVQAGFLTKEEGEQMLAAGGPEPKKQGTCEGEVSKNGEELFYSIESRGDENDYEIVKAGPNGLSYLKVTPNADGFDAVAYKQGGDGEGYKETLSGGWNLAG